MWFNPPTRQEPYLDRQIDCQEALEPGFQIISEEMIAAGRSRDEIQLAFVNLLAAHDRTQESNAEQEVELAFMCAQMRLPKP